MAPHLFDGVHARETGQDLEDYARNRLFEPLGIHDHHWKRSPLGEGYQYGYQCWLVPYDNGSRHAWAALGFGGQNVFVMPEDGIVAVANGGAALCLPRLDTRNLAPSPEP